ncbi:TcfC E-set like domain-containing protein [Aliikangiella maris]|uniref:TcfC E-set like domain-containing protein n=1 Tax=Aliikangiella maris TaxID=3162458 RepID=A0ABV3MT88_9GAMM
MSTLSSAIWSKVQSSSSQQSTVTLTKGLLDGARRIAPFSRINAPSDTLFKSELYLAAVSEIKSESEVNSGSRAQSESEISKKPASNIKSSTIKRQKKSTAFKSSEKKLLVTTPPPGFDDLLTPHFTLVDVYFNQRLLGVTMASYTSSHLIFQSPQEVAGFIANTKNTVELASYLSQPLLNNQILVCHYQGQTGCGNLQPDNVGIIFSQGKHRVDLFIHPALLSIPSLLVDKYLPPSTSGPSFLSAISLVASGGDAREDIYTAKLNNLFSIENYRVYSSLEKDDKNSARLDQLSLSYEYRDMAYQVGSFRTNSQSNSFFEQREILGVRVQSSLASRVDLAQVSGTRLFVFLSEHSRVEIYKDGQLIDSREYQAGNIELNTQDFPQGSYTLEIKIIGDSGREAMESRFFTKSLQLPPLDESLYFVEVGFPEDEQIQTYPVAKDQPFARLGFVTRSADWFGFNSALAADDKQQMLELGTVWFANQIEIQSNHAFTSNNQQAVFYQLGVHHPSYFVSASYRRTFRGNQQLPVQDYSFLKPDVKQTLLNVSIPFSDAVLNVYARTNLESTGEMKKNYGISWRKNVYRTDHLLLDWTVDLTKENHDKRLITGFTLRFIEKDYNLNSSMNYNRLKSQSQYSSHFDKNFRLNVQQAQSLMGDLNHSLNVTETTSQISSLWQSEITNRLGHTRVTLENINQQNTTDDSGVNKSHRQGYALTSHLNFVVDDGQVVMGGSRQSTAGILINIQQESSSSTLLSLRVNGEEKVQINSGESHFIALAPYQTYRLTLAPLQGELVSFDNTPKDITLYPGNVESVTWSMTKLYIVVMQLLNNDDKPFANARLNNEKFHAGTDDLGWVQMELHAAGEYLFIDNNERQCRVIITDKALQQSINYLGSVRCQ